MKAMSAHRITKLIECLPPGAQPTSEDMLRYYSVWVELVPGTVVAGLWCDTCALPSRYQVAIYVLGDDGPSQVGVYDRCDGHQP